MFVGVLKEAANHAHRVGLTPKRVGELVINGHNVVVETGAGHGINAEDDANSRRALKSCKPQPRFSQTRK